MSKKILIIEDNNDIRENIVEILELAGYAVSAANNGRTGVELALKGGRVSVPASLLAGLGAPWNTLQASGLLELSSQDLIVEWQQGSLRIAGQAELKALDLSSRLSPLRPLGTYRLTLRGGAVPGLELETLEGSLMLEGRGQWSGSRLQFKGTASAKPERAEALSNLLNLIGRRKGDLSIISMV